MRPEEGNERLVILNRPSSAELADCNCIVAPQTLSLVVVTQSDTGKLGPEVVKLVEFGPLQSLPAEKNAVTVALALGAPMPTASATKNAFVFIILLATPFGRNDTAEPSFPQSP